MKRKPAVGEVLYAVDTGNRARYRQCSYDAVVTKVGRTYFTVRITGKEDKGYSWEVQFHIEDWRQKTDYSVDYALYESEQHFHDRVKAGKWHEVFRRKFVYGGNDFTLAQLEEAAKILGLTLEEP